MKELNKNERSYLIELDVVNILKELTTTIFSCEEYKQNRLELHYGWVAIAWLSEMFFVSYCYREQLEKALQFYKSHMPKPAREPKPPVITESLIGMVFLCNKTGEHDKEEDYLEKTLQELRVNFREAIPPERSVSSAWNSMLIDMHASNKVYCMSVN